ncbi:hypothetical protein [Brenneria roseae]|uniref:hypothetical protein n=1 Tax=Brenneria roseae TaxID=1509241 RepID=UPI001FE27720|nr:hypothetical protein [Brenneria roseae]
MSMTAMSVTITMMMLLVSFNIMAGLPDISDEQVKEKIIQASISAYPGNCSCPYNSARK